jgi:hypothetical protein
MRGHGILTVKALAITFALGLSCGTTARAQKAAAGGGATLTADDRAGIQELVAHYARALATCSSKEYAELFTPDGVFFSDDFRGKTHRELYGKSARLVGRTKIAELVETEEFCKDPAIRAERVKSGGGNAARPPAAPVLEATAEGAKGTIPIGKGGRYEDVYVKTQDGWRFKSRSVFMPPVADAPPASSPAR